MFARSQQFYDAIYAWKDYAAEVERLDGLIRQHAPAARTLVDVACGTGTHLALLRGRYQVQGVDLDPQMLELARQRLGPDVALHAKDMVDFDLGRRFDVVTCLFSSIAYVRTPDALEQTVVNLARHVASGGMLIVEPFITPEQWQDDKVSANFVDQPDLKVARMDVSRSRGPIGTLTFRYLVGTPDGVEHFTETHELGLFSHEQYVAAFRAARLKPSLDAAGLMGRGLYLAVHPG